MIAKLLEAGITIHAMRDITRGGLSAALNELAIASQVRIAIDEEKIPIRPEVRGFCEISGFDPIHLANEGKLVLALPAEQVEQALSIMHPHPLGQQAACIGMCHTTHAGLVTIDTGFGGGRILEMLVGEQLPRIC